MLDRWPPKARTYYVLSRATGMARNRAQYATEEVFKEDGVDLHRYRGHRAFERFETSDQFKEMYEAEQKRIRDEAFKHGFSHAGSRIFALNETAEKTITAMRGMEPEEKAVDWGRLSSVLVSTFKEIREEVGPETSPAKESPFQKMFDSQNLSKDPKGEEMVLSMAKKILEERAAADKPN